MKKAIISVMMIWLILAGAVCPVSAWAAEAYESYSYDSRGNAVPSQAGYTAVKSVSGSDIGTESFDSPSDIFLSGDGMFYIADTGNDRVIVVDSNFEGVCGIYESFILSDGSKTNLSEPTGIFVSAERDMMYIADSGNSRVLVCSTDGQVKMEITKPDSPVYDSNKTFIPRKVIADKAGNIYVQLGNFTTGAAMFSPDGEFMGFYGANRTEPTAEVVLKYIRNLFSSEEKRSQRTRTVPAGITGFDIDGDFIFTCTSSSTQKLDTVKKLNAAGKNIFANKEMIFGDLTPVYNAVRNEFLAPSIIDIDVSEEGFINCLDLTTGRVFQYDEDCELIFIAGTKASQLGGFKEPAAVESAEGKLYVLDSGKNTITVFEETEFGRTVHSAVTLYNDGYYEEALEPWYEVLRRDGNYRRAYVGVASALLNKGDYSGAMKYARLGYATDIYNKAFEGWREIFIREHFVHICVIIALLVIAYIFRQRLLSAAGRIKVRIFRTVGRLRKKYVRRNSRTKITKYKGTILILIMMFFGQIAEGRLYGFQFGYPDDRTFSIVPYIVRSFVIFAAWVIGSRAVSTFLDGSGTAGRICVSSARALVPYIVQLFVCTGLSHILIQDEVVFIQIIRIAGIAVTAVMLFIAVKNVHCYSVGRTAFSVVLTIAAMLIMLFLLVLFMSLIQQIWLFICTIWTEITYRIRMG
ncbi:MAG: hypothetical protein IKK47_03280 [Ruminococcus sp.]|nr:hypothetical protein [Ruminococcus sp.]